MSAVNVILRPPQRSDYEALASWIPDRAACLRWAGPGVRFPLVPAELPARLAVPGESYVLAKSGAVPIGFGQAWQRIAGEVHLGRIIVSPDARGGGVGRILCERLLDQAVRGTGSGIVTLRVYRDNEAALALYASLGFDPVEAHCDHEILFMRAVARR